jgi:hypothetical protein
VGSARLELLISYAVTAIMFGNCIARVLVGLAFDFHVNPSYPMYRTQRTLPNSTVTCRAVVSFHRDTWLAWLALVMGINFPIFAMFDEFSSLVRHAERAG